MLTLLTAAILVGMSALFLNSFAFGATIPATGTVLNNYAAVTSISGTTIGVSSTAGFVAGDTALLVQAKGASVNTSDTGSHGDIISYGAAGRFEYVEIQSVGGSSVVLEATPTISFNTAGSVQLVRVATYNDYTLTGTVSGSPWNGSSGGIVAIDVTGTLTLSGAIDVTGLGFDGGALAVTTPYDSCASDQTNYTGPVQNGTGNKGEGIVVDTVSHMARRGHRANGGGGGNITDAGGGGGGNYGQGGLGGRELDLCDNDGHFGGLGGQALSYISADRLYFGGGGGSGSEISQAATGGPRTGGGLVFLRANTMVSSGGTIMALGLDSNNDDVNGADGGGAGGSVTVAVTNGLSGGLTIDVSGGNGGSEQNPSIAHGPGGGGGGGPIALHNLTCGSISWASSGGTAGVSDLGTAAGDPNWGAIDGDPGACFSGFSSVPLLPNYDYSDAPLSGTSFGGASHEHDANIRLGGTVTVDAADYDDPNAAGDSDDGVVLPALVQSEAATIIASVVGSGGFLQCWMDWNGDGDFGDAGEQIATNFVDGGTGDDDGTLNGVIELVTTPPATSITSQTFARFRWSTDNTINSAGPAPDGEVEDYALTVAAAVPSLTIAKTASAPGFTTGNVQQAPAGTVVTYTFVVTNNGNVTISSVAVSDLHNGTGSTPLPGGEALTNDTGTIGDSSDGTIDGIWDTLAPGDEITLTSSYTVTQEDVDTLQ